MKIATKLLLTALFLVCCGGLAYVSLSGRTVDFAGTVTAVRAEADDVYVTAPQDGSDFTCEIRLKKATRCRSLASDTLKLQDIAVGDRILLNWRNKPTYTDDGLGHATARGTVKVIPQSKPKK